MKRRTNIVIAATLAAVLFAGCGDSRASSEVSAADDPAAQEQEAEVNDVSAQGEKDAAADETATDVKVNVKKDRFMLPEITMLTTESVDLQYQFAKKIGKVKWTSSNPKVVKVGKNGSEITAKKAGKATVEGATSDGAHRFRCEVTVEKKPKNIIYMTFDDGPSSYSTPKVLNILKKNNVKATFFEIKPAKENYKLTQRVIDEGHTLAIHGYSHSYNVIYKSDEAYHSNLTKLQKLFYKKFGVWSTQTRFPGGSSNTVSRHYSHGIMTRLSKKVHKWGFKYQDWNVSSGDAGGANNADQVYKYVKSGIQKGRSNVILMHDFSGNDKTINALQRIIDYGKANGFEFRAMTAATNEVHHGVNN